MPQGMRIAEYSGPEVMRLEDIPRAIQRIQANARRLQQGLGNNGEDGGGAP